MVASFQGSNLFFIKPKIFPLPQISLVAYGAGMQEYCVLGLDLTMRRRLQPTLEFFNLDTLICIL